jgi:hypothetical protein
MSVVNKKTIYEDPHVWFRNYEQGSALGALTETGPSLKKKATQVLWWCLVV